uniref:Transposase Tc1-like domain-containing protein n=1 Tax=Lates calcarifer TaxID=8187 RepID=A0A4W6FDK9_LATCA
VIFYYYQQILLKDQNQRWNNQQTMTDQTVRTLREFSLNRQPPKRKPLCTQLHRTASLTFAKEQERSLIEYWQHILLSDETKIKMIFIDVTMNVLYLNTG